MSWIKTLFKKIIEFFNRGDEDREGETPVKIPDNEPKPPTNIDQGNGVRSDWMDKALRITGSFEGTGFGQVTGNFDGQAISAGILQWNYGQGSLQSKILKPMIAKFGLDPFDHFHVPSLVIESAYMTPSEAKRHAKKYMLTWNGKVKAEWDRGWRNFLQSSEGQRIQTDAAQDIGLKALGYCQKYRLFSDRSFCFFFDVVTQNGSMKGLPEPSPSYVIENFDRMLREDGGINYNLWKNKEVNLQQMTLWVMICQRVVRNRWASDVLSRKGTIIFGEGVVHGSTRSFNFDTNE